VADAPDPRVYTSLRALARLRHAGADFNYLPRQRIGSLLSGRRRSRLRGRGLDFDELRNYRPGDDIRTMDWRVTNRTGRPHVRVYNEERDRPVIAVVDQRLPMFFGSVARMKSVVAAEVAAVTAWRVLAVGDRIGAVLFNDKKCLHTRPTRSDRRVIGWLGDLASMNNALSVEHRPGADANALTGALETLERRIGHDHLVILISDFFGCDEATFAAIRRIRAHNDVLCAHVYDPLERDISQASQLVVSDGRYQLEIDPAHEDLGSKFEASFEHSMQHVSAQLRRHDIPVLPISTVEPVVAQLGRLLNHQKHLQ
jgi:uncharacterized protein (DUF58 family)